LDVFALLFNKIAVVILSLLCDAELLGLAPLLCVTRQIFLHANLRALSSHFKRIFKVDGI